MQERGERKDVDVEENTTSHRNFLYSIKLGGKLVWLIHMHDRRTL